jgi:phosphatidate cytidylyltransferase
MYFSNLQKRVFTALVALLFVSFAFYFNFLHLCFWPFIVILFYEIVAATIFSQVSIWKRALVFLIGSFYGYYGALCVYLSIEHFQILSLIIGVAGVDSVAFFFGRWWQGALLAPRISPKKTIAGFVAALIFSTLWGPFLWADLQIRTNLIFGLIFGLLFGFIVQMGDLFVSIGKRTLKIKDSSSLLPGHGGFWDRCDSIFAGSLFISLCFFFKSYILKILP